MMWAIAYNTSQDIKWSRFLELVFSKGLRPQTILEIYLSWEDSYFAITSKCILQHEQVDSTHSETTFMPIAMVLRWYFP